MKIAILYICVGRYSAFWPGFFRSCEAYFCPGAEKHYFVFADGRLPGGGHPAVETVPYPHAGWPDVTLFRFHAFAEIRKRLSAFDYIFFFNANCEFVAPIRPNDLPSASEGLVAVHHPGFWNKSRRRFPIENRRTSAAHLPRSRAAHYLTGGVNGGTRHAFLDLIAACRAAVEADRAAGLVARWHDESHLNKYLSGRPYKLWHPGFAYPEGWSLPFPPRIRLRDKARLGGHDYLRGMADAPSPPAPQPPLGVRLLGGLGNQMFQYAAARAAAHRLGTEILLDTDWFQPTGRRPDRPFRLNAFPNLAGRIAERSDLRAFRRRRNLPVRILRHYLAKAEIGPLWSAAGRLTSYVGEPYFHYWPDFWRMPAGSYLSGFWQSEKYFAGAAHLLRQDFAFPPLEDSAAREVRNRIAEAAHPVAIHVRRGDYLEIAKGAGAQYVSPPDYYRRALARLAHAHAGLSLFLFSDDPDWLRGHFDTGGRLATIVDIPAHRAAAHHDMHLMSLCRHHVIANSTFSWWAAWLSGTDGQVIAPKNWFADATHDTRDLIPAVWARV